MLRYWLGLRALLATIKNLGQYPCPRCLIPKKKIDVVGTPSDVRRHKNRAHKDDDRRRGDVKNVRKLMFERGCSIQNKLVKNLLNSRSLVLTRVCTLYYHDQILTRLTECILANAIWVRTGLSWPLRHRSPTWVWDQHLEVGAHSFDPDAVCDPRRSGTHSNPRHQVSLLLCHKTPSTNR